ncbi:MAG: hypothetical protein OXJ90_23800 [Spirochaetaceae bacterium]|nr:hypothetical protein [Spirochaetaceae bacterium]
MSEAAGALAAMRWRSIGPYRGGRVVAVAGDPVEPLVFYFGACAGGVWKTTDAGRFWRNVSDGYFRTGSVGAIAVAPSAHRTVYAGMGETQIRVDVTHGDGVYRSDDGGESWRHLGLEATRHVSRIRVHPRDPDTVYVAALGLAFGRNPERGVYRSTDGGATWEQVLYRSEEAGAGDLCLDPNRPNVLFAALWQTIRKPWTIRSGGPDSGIFRSTDGGATWQELTGRPGLPRGILGRVGIAASPARAGRVWALIEAEDGGLYRSDDDGESWQLVTNDTELREKPFYFTHVYAHPTDPEQVWSLCKKVYRSTDGGHTFEVISSPHHDDHDLWFDPANPMRMIEGNDGGATVSLDGGETWSSIYNQPTAQYYRMEVDDRFPYRVYATQQDSSAVSVPSDSVYGAIRWADCYTTGSAESGHIAVKRDDPDIVYAGATGSSPGGPGSLMRYDHRSGQVRLISPVPGMDGSSPPAEWPARFNWTFPVLSSRHDPDVLLTAGNVVFRSTDEGGSWEPISPDLTRDDPDRTVASGGPITGEGPSDVYCTVIALAESLARPREIWAGSDDGRVHRTRDGGKSWHEVTPADLPEWASVLCLEPSPHDPDRWYLAATRYRLDDTRPMLYRTDDGGASWQSIIGDLPADDFTRVIRCDPERPGLLYCGTETGAYASLDDGGSWTRMNDATERWSRLPAVPVYDLRVHQGDLVAATHGRSFWILDDLTPLRRATAWSAPALVAPRPTVRTLPQVGWDPWTGPQKTYQIGSLGVEATFVEHERAGDGRREFLDSGSPRPRGALIYYWLPEGSRTASIRIVDPSGRPVRRFASDATDAAADDLPCDAGLNRLIWDLTYSPYAPSPGADDPVDTGVAPLAAPGEYCIELAADGSSDATSVHVASDPRVGADPRDLQEQTELLIRIRAAIADVMGALAAIERRREQEAPPSESLDEIERILHRVVPPGDLARNHVGGVLEGIASLAPVIASADAAPTRQAREAFERWHRHGQAALLRLSALSDE